jgi:serine/threonine protein kinase
MGVVWEAWDERLERAVALKQLRTLPGVPEAEAEEAKERAMREARITARLHHPHAVPVFDAVEHDGQPCLVMQFVPSTPLSAVLRDGGPLPVGRAARIGSEVASALAAAHTLGIVHRDVKPGNILITGDGAAHISDFGISHAMGDATLTRTGMIHGTPAYLAPEVARGEEASFPADVFSLGSTLFAALEGSPPFGAEANSLAVLHKVAAADVPEPTRAGTLTPLLLEMLSPVPDSRPSMEAVALALSRATTEDQHAPGEALPPTAPIGEPKPEAVELAALLGMEAQPAAGSRQDAPVASGVPEDPAGPDTQATSPGRERRRARMALLGGLGLLAVALVLAFTLSDSLFGDDREGGTAASTSTPAPSSPSTQPSTSEPAEPTPTPSETASDTATRPPSPKPTPTTASPTEPASAGRAALLSSAITDYYALLPKDTARAWSGMTADYQSSHAGGRASYDSFWSKIEDVRVSDVSATPPDRVVATLTYSRSDGRVDIEQTSYRIFEEGGRWKIADSKVLSSRRG